MSDANSDQMFTTIGSSETLEDKSYYREGD